MTGLGPEWGPVAAAGFFVVAKLAVLGILYVLKV